MITSKFNATQGVPNVAANTNQHPCSHTPKFDSWALLCQGTGRQYPTTNDVFYSPNYAKTPKGLKENDDMNFDTKTFIKNNTDCRVCKFLEESGTHKEELYTSHYSNFPTHCPQWTKMDVADRTRIAKLTHYCP